MNYYTRAFKNYANFKGRDSRKQFWMFILFNFVISLIIQVVAALILGDSAAIIMSIYELIVLIPSIAIIVRRLHDINKSGFWIFINCVPLIGWIWYLILVCKKGDEGSNRYGSVPTEE
ncbi:MAG: DUF805 domain-containing protein [Clostridiales bacterium]|nr:DUF805 domain-containing protein [Clostridiales bacterium]